MKKHNNIDNDTLSERATRLRMLNDVELRFGPDGRRQVQMVFDKYDRLLNNCTNEVERQHIKKVAAAEIFTMIGYKGGLAINNEVIIPAEEELEELTIKS